MVWIIGAVCLAAGVVAAFLLLRSGDPAERPAVELGPVAEPPADTPDRPLGADVEPLDLPPLGASDELVRSLVRGLTTHPQVAAWLATDELIRNFTVTVDQIATGASPARHLRVLRPAEPFEVATSSAGTVISPVSYQRYAPLAAAVASIDPVGAARLYAMLKPRIEDAARELGLTEPFDRTLERAILVLLDTPVPDERVRVVPVGGVYAFERPSLESLSSAQKQFVRMGPDNVRAIQGQLQAIALALGVPVERLAHAGW